MVIPESRKRPNWLKYSLLDVEGHGTTKGTFTKNKKPKIYSDYVVYMKNLIKYEWTTFEEDVKNQDLERCHEWRVSILNEKWSLVDCT